MQLDLWLTKEGNMAPKLIIRHKEQPNRLNNMLDKLNNIQKTKLSKLKTKYLKQLMMQNIMLRIKPNKPKTRYLKRLMMLNLMLKTQLTIYLIKNKQLKIEL